MLRWMQHSRPSSSAQHVALARAHLTWMGLLEDCHAETMLRPPWAALGRALRRRPLTRLGRNRSFAYLAARTRFYDDAVVQALDDGITQVVVIGAGYDSRAWRLARPGVRFFEVDQPRTQADKQARAPAGGPRYVPAELGQNSLGELLPAVGFAMEKTTVFTVEGVTMYLTEPEVTGLLTTLGRLGGPGSRLAVNFGVGFGGADSRRTRVRATMGRALVALGREPIKFELSPRGAAAFLAGSGWIAQEVVTGPDLADRYLAGTGLPMAGLNPRAFVTTATRT
jgi:methyltransferase (TIGR00027 family)